MKKVCGLLFLAYSLTISARGLTREVKLKFDKGCISLSNKNKKIILDEYVKVGKGDWLYFTTVSSDELKENKFLAHKKAKIRNRKIGKLLQENGVLPEKITYKYSRYEQIWVNKQNDFEQSVAVHGIQENNNVLIQRFKNIDGFTFVMSSGNILEFKPMSFEGFSEDVITLKIKEYTSKIDFVKYGVTAQGDKGMLETQGMYFIEAFSNDQKINLRRGAAYNLKIKQGKENEKFYSFYGKNKGGTLTWTKNQNEPFIAMELNDKIINKPIEEEPEEGVMNLTTDNAYSSGKFGAFYIDDQGNLQSGVPSSTEDVEVYWAESESEAVGRYLVGKFSALGWINCDRFYDAPNKIVMQVEINNGVCKNDFAVYIIFHDINSVLPLSKVTNGHYRTPKIPEGENVTIFAVHNSKKTANNHLAFKKVTVKSEKVKIESKEIDRTALEKYMNDVIY